MIKNLKKGLAAVMAAALVFAAPVTVANAETATEVTTTTLNSSTSGLESLSGDFNVTYTFHNVSNGTENYHNFVVEMRDASNNCIDVRADNWGWTWLASTSSSTDFPDTYKNPTNISGEVYSDWDNFAAKMKAGVDVNVNVARSGSTFAVKATIVDYAVFSYSIPFEAMGSDITITLGGEKCTLTNIKFQQGTVEVTSGGTSSGGTAAGTTTETGAGTEESSDTAKKTMKLSKVKTKKNTKKVTGQVSVKKATVKIAIKKKGKKKFTSFKKATVSGKKFTFKTKKAGIKKLTKGSKVKIKVTKSGYTTLTKTYTVK